MRLALPVVFICFLIDLAFGFLNRVAPQINAYFLSLPAKMMGGLIMLFFLIPLLLDEFLEHHDHMMAFLKIFINPQAEQKCCQKRDCMLDRRA